jgi:hypothetical protein
VTKHLTLSGCSLLRHLGMQAGTRQLPWLPGVLSQLVRQAQKLPLLLWVKPGLGAECHVQWRDAQVLQGSRHELAAPLALLSRSILLDGAYVRALLLLLLGRLLQRRQHLLHETGPLPRALHRVPAQAVVTRWGHWLTGC